MVEQLLQEPGRRHSAAISATLETRAVKALSRCSALASHASLSVSNHKWRSRVVYSAKFPRHLYSLLPRLSLGFSHTGYQLHMRYEIRTCKRNSIFQIQLYSILKQTQNEIYLLSYNNCDLMNKSNRYLQLLCFIFVLNHLFRKILKIHHYRYRCTDEERRNRLIGRSSIQYVESMSTFSTTRVCCSVIEALPMVNSYCAFDWLVTSKYNRISSAR